MKAKMLLVVVLLFAVTTAAFCQLAWKPRNMTTLLALVNPATGLPYPNSDTDTTHAIPRGTPIYLFQDNSGDGAPNCVPNDTIPALRCYVPITQCSVTRGFSKWQFAVADGGAGMFPGYFNITSAIQTKGQCPTVLRFYFECLYPKLGDPEASFGRIEWISPVIIPTCPTQDTRPIPDSWCYRIIPPTCQTTSPNFVVYTADHAPADYTDRHACVTLCNVGDSYTVWVGPLAASNRTCTIDFTPGCLTCGDPNCTAGGTFSVTDAWGHVDNNGVAAPENHPWFYHKTFTLTGTHGCFCMNFSHILPVEAASVAAVAGDGEVQINWNTASESNLTGFQVRRNDGVASEVIAAKNTASGASYSWKHDATNGTTYTYTLRVINADESYTDLTPVTATPSLDKAIVTEYALRQNYPNPFNPSTRIMFDVKDSNPVTLKIYNAMGQEVTTLLSNEMKAGGKRYSVNFDASNLPSGLYFYSVKIGNDFSATKKMLLVK